MSLAQLTRYNALAVEIQARERLQAIEDRAVPWMSAEDRHAHLERLRTLAGAKPSKAVAPAGVRIISQDQVRTFLGGG